MINQLIFRVFNIFLDYVKANFLAVVVFCLALAVALTFFEGVDLVYKNYELNKKIFFTGIQFFTGVSDSGVYTGDTLAPHIIKVFGTIGFLFFLVLETLRLLGFSVVSITFKNGLKFIFLVMLGLFLIMTTIVAVRGGGGDFLWVLCILWLVSTIAYIPWFGLRLFQQWFVGAQKEQNKI